MSGGSRPTVRSGFRVVSEAGSPDPGRSDGDPVASPDRASDTGDATAIVGRDTELARLRTLRDAAFAGRAGTVMIAGEAGVGKTSVINAFVAETQLHNPSVRVVRGECVPLGGEGLPYAPVVGLLHDLADQAGVAELLNRAGAGSAELHWLIPEFGAADQPVDGTTPENRLRLFETIFRLIEAAGRDAPLIVVVEDLHWVDDSSRHLIDFLVRAMAGVPVLILISYRTDELTRRHPLRPFLAEIGRVPTVHRVEIGPLDDAALEQLVLLSSPSPDRVQVLDRVDDRPQLRPDDRRRPELIKRVSRASAGIPYFAVELVRASHSGDELPQTLRDTLLLRISRVGDDCQQLLRLMAVAGNRIEHDLVAAVCELPAGRLEQLLREATEANLLVPDKSGYAFRHALMREVLHDDLLPGEVTRLHRSYAKTLEDHPELMSPPVRAVELAHHWYAARDNRAAFGWSVQAARLQRYGYAEALRHYERALELWEVAEDPQTVAGPLPDFLDEASETASDSGDVERSLAMINEALRVAGPDADPQATALRLARKARRMLTLVQPGVLDLIDQAVSLVGTDRPTRFLASLLDYRALIQLLLDKPASVASARAAIEAAQAVADPDIESSARNTLGCALATLGIDPDQGLEQLRLAGELAVDDRTRIRYHVNLSDTLNLLGRHRESVEAALTGRELAARVGRERHIGVMMASNAAESLIAMGDWAAARQLITGPLYVNPAANHWIQHRRLLATVSLWMDDDADRAEEILRDLGHYTSIAINGPQYHVGIRFAEAELALARNDPDSAWDTVQSVIESLHWPEPGHDLGLLAIGAAAYGRRADRPAAWAAWITEQLRLVPPFPVAAQWLPFIEAELADSVERWDQAVVAMTRAKTPPHMLAYGYLRLAEHQAAAGLGEESRQSAGVARELADRMGLRLVLRWLKELLPEATAGNAQDESPLAVLTPREREVLDLVSDGLSNRQIGDRLVISAKTASVHVSNILAKLGVGSRLEAAARNRQAAR